MLTRCIILAAATVTVATVAACDFESVPSSGGGVHKVEGQVVDFETGAAVTSAASVTTLGLNPLPQVTAQGAAFTIDRVLADSAFQILAAAPPTHRATVSQVVVVDSDVVEIEAPVVSEAFLATLTGAFGVTQSAASGVVMIRLVDDGGAPRAGVMAASLAIPGANGPHFLDASLKPAPAAVASTASGWVAFFNVPVGVVALVQAPDAVVTLELPASPVTAGAVTIAEAVVRDGAPVLPVAVRFATEIVPIFGARGCQVCHSGGGPGKDLGGLTLDGSANLIYKELVEERPNVRVQLASPESSLVLTMPSREVPPDRHPNTTFTGPRDPDYLKLLVWIREGAKQN